MYRVNVVWEVLMRNVSTYVGAGGQGEWHYIIFDHNKEEVLKAEALAESLGLKFYTRRSTRNFITFVNKNQQRITASDTRIHDHIDEYRQIKPALRKIENSTTASGGRDNTKEKANDNGNHAEGIFRSKNLTPKEFEILNNLSSTVDCWNVHKHQLFIDSHMRVWPCCHFSDMFAKGSDPSFSDSLPENEEWNHLSQYSLREILSHPFFNTLEERWKLTSSTLTQRCLVSCGGGGKFKSTIQKPMAEEKVL